MRRIIKAILNFHVNIVALLALPFLSLWGVIRWHRH